MSGKPLLIARCSIETTYKTNVCRRLKMRSPAVQVPLPPALRV